MSPDGIGSPKTNAAPAAPPTSVSTPEPATRTVNMLSLPVMVSAEVEAMIAGWGAKLPLRPPNVQFLALKDESEGLRKTSTA